MNTSSVFHQLIEEYRASEQFCVFTGAGVSFTQDPLYRAPGWRQLLYDILTGLIGEEKSPAVFDRLSSEHPDLWHLATAIQTFARDERHFTGVLRAALLRENETVDHKKRLKRRHLNGATTLNALIAFCSDVREMRAHPCFGTNPKVRAVLTANYDWLFEAGATAKHQAYRFKPMARPGSSEERGKLPVYHIHGYLPYSADGLPDEPLILDYRSYEAAYQRGGWTVEILERFLSRYPTLFIGFSFEDEFFLRQLQRQSRRRAAPRHFALLRNGDQRPPDLLSRIEDAGVNVILYREHSQIPSLLRHLYCAGLPPSGVAIEQRGAGAKFYSWDEVWNMLLQDKQYPVAAI